MKNAIVVMSRVPKPGYTKTRLMEKLTAEECAEFHLACLKDIIAAVDEIAATRCIYFTGGKPEYFQGLNLAGFTLHRQLGQHLGARLYNAASEILNNHNKLLLIGSDMPDLPPRLLQEAFDCLEDNDVVIGPAVDGGYYLLGMSYPQARLFQDIPWGTDRVYASTLKALEQSKLKHCTLETRADLDTWEDLANYYQRYSQQSIRWLSTQGFVEKIVMQYGLK